MFKFRRMISELLIKHQLMKLRLRSLICNQYSNILTLGKQEKKSEFVLSNQTRI